jgi:hypothetical protein
MSYTYRIHQKNSAGTKAFYKCVRKTSSQCPAVATLDIQTSRILKISHSHTHGPNLLVEAARQEERRMIRAAAAVGKFSQVEVLSRVKSNILRSDLPEARSEIRKSHALGQALQREKKKLQGVTGAVPKSPAAIQVFLFHTLVVNI